MTSNYALVSVAAVIAATFAFACSSNDASRDALDRNQSAIDPEQGGRLGGNPSTPLPAPGCEGGAKPTLVPCTAAAPPPVAAPPPADAGDAGPVNQQGACAGGVCKPGSVRYCDNDVEDWALQQKCSPAGQWSACTASTTSPAGAGPIKDKQSCMDNKLCCQEDEGGEFFDYGTGACAALECAK